MYISGTTCLIKGEMFKNLSSDEFFDFCRVNEELSFERDEQGNIVLVASTGTISGYYNNSISAQLYNWNKAKQLGKTFDSNTGFTLPDGSQRSPDASWISNKKWAALNLAERQKFAFVCPEFIIELKSINDHLNYLQSKMEMWMNNGVELAWLIDPYEQNIHIYEPLKQVKIISNFKQPVSGEPVLPNFLLDLADLLEQ